MRAYVHAGTVWVEQDGASLNTRLTRRGAAHAVTALRAVLRAPRPTRRTIHIDTTVIDIETTRNDHWPILVINDWDTYTPTAPEFSQLLNTLDRFSKGLPAHDDSRAQHRPRPRTTHRNRRPAA